MPITMMYPPFARKDFIFTKPFGPKGADEFWAYRNRDGNRDFGFFVEHVPRMWPYGSWAGGSLQLFWTSDTGILTMCRHNFKDTGDFSMIDQWPTEHVWGRSASGQAFSNAKYYRCGKGKVSGHFTGKHPSVEFTAGFAAGKSPFDRSAKVKSRFTAIGNGIKVTKSVSGGSREVKELWATIPVFLASLGEGGKSKDGVKDTTIEYKLGGWKHLGTQLVETGLIRLGRDFGGGTKYGYIYFESPTKVKLSSKAWIQHYQANLRLRNIHMSLHKNPGRSTPMPKSSVTYCIITKPEPKQTADKMANIPEIPKASDKRSRSRHRPSRRRRRHR